jgi:hypothetical protein
MHGLGDSHLVPPPLTDSLFLHPRPKIMANFWVIVPISAFRPKSLAVAWIHRTRILS